MKTAVLGRAQGAGEMGKEPIKSHEDLEVYQMAFDAAMKIFQLSKKFPVEERYSLTDQIRRSSRSVCANLAEAWRKRRYEAANVAKLNDCDQEAEGQGAALAGGRTPCFKAGALSITKSCASTKVPRHNFFFLVHG